MTSEVILGHRDMTIDEAIRILFNHKITGFPVVDDQRRVVGVISEFDVIQAVKKLSGKLPIDLHQPVRITKKVTTILEDTSLEEILALFLEKKVRRLPVINAQKQVVGIISRRDVMRVLFYQSKAAAL